MAVTKDDLLVAIKADTKDANVQLAAMTDKFDKLNEAMNVVVASMTKTEKQIGFMDTTIIQLNQALELGQKAWTALSEPIKKAINDAEEASTAFDKMRITLKFFGEKDADTAAAGFKEVADAIEAATGASAEASLGFAAQAKTFGLSNDRIKNLLVSASDLAAIMGTDVNSAAARLLQTMNGQTKAVEKYVPALKGLTLAQLQDGQAIDVVAGKLEGLGAAFGKTAEGVNKRLEASMGKPFEAVGVIIEDTFDIIANKEAKIKFFDDLEVRILAVKPLVQSFVQGLKDSFAGIAMAASAAFVVLNIQKWIAAIQIATAATKKQSISTLLLAKAQNVLNIGAVKFVGLTSAFLLMAATVETLAKNANNIGDVFSLAFNRVLAAGNRVLGMMAKLTGNSKASAEFEEAADRYAIAADRLSRRVEIGTFGKTLQSISKFADVAQGDLSSLNKESKQTKDILDQIKVPKGLQDTGVLSREVADKLKDFGSVIATLNAASQEQSGNEMQALRAKLAADQMSLDIKAKEIADTDKLAGAEAKRLAEVGKVLQASIANRDIAEKQAKLLEDQLQRSKDLQIQVDSYSKSQREILDMQIQRALDLIDLDEKRLEKTGMLTDEIRAQYDLQRTNISKDGANRRKETVSTAFENASKIGGDIGKAISGTFSEGIQGEIMGMINGISSMVSAAQAVVDAGPALLDSIGNLINSVTELPLKLMEGVTKIVGAIGGFLNSFIENIGTMVSGILDAVVGLIEQLPQMIVKFISDIPRIIGDIFSKLPDIIESLVTSLIESAPMIALGLVEFFVKDAPRIAFAIVKVLAVQLPIAIVKGVVNAFKNVFSSIGRLFSGGNVFKNVGKNIAESFTSNVKKLSGSTSKLFGIKDLGDSLGGDEVKNTLASIKEAGEKAYGWIIKAWTWVKDNILTPLWNFITAPFIFVWEAGKAVFNYIIESFKNMWNFVKSMFMVVVNIFKAAFSFITGLFKDPVKAFEKLWSDIKNIFSDAINAFSNFFSGIGSTFSNLGKSIWDGFIKAFEKTGNWFANMGTSIWNSFKAGFDSFGNFLKKLFTFDGGGKGAVEKFLGFDFPFIAFAQGGTVPGKATMPGDSAKNDTVPALLSPGEVVIPRSMLQDEAFARVIRAKFNGEKVEGHFLGKVGNALKKAGDWAGDALSGGGNFLGNVFSKAGQVGGWLKDRIADLPEDALNGLKATLSAAQRFGSSSMEFINRGLFSLMPKWIKDLWDSISKYITEINIKKLISDPAGALKDALKGFAGVFQPMFLRMTEPMRAGLKMATGGLVPGVGNTDSVSAMLMPGEFVMSKPAVQNIGLENLRAMNSGRASDAQPASYTFNIDMKFDMKDPIDENAVRNRILPRLKDELRRASENGDYILNLRGTRK